MRHEIGCYGVCANDDKGKGPAPLPSNIDYEIEPRCEQKAPPTTIKCPTRCPNSFHNRTYPKHPKGSSSDEGDDTCNCKPSDFFPVRTVSVQNFPRNQPEHHRA